MSEGETEIVAMTLEEATEICRRIDWSDGSRFTKEEHDAIVSVTTRYMCGEITREHCAEVLGKPAEELPVPWLAKAGSA